jgi:hypothetical protein
MKKAAWCIGEVLSSKLTISDKFSQTIVTSSNQKVNTTKSICLEGQVKMPSTPDACFDLYSKNYRCKDWRVSSSCQSGGDRHWILNINWVIQENENVL